MKCDICKTEEATLHIPTNHAADGTLLEFDLCGACAEKAGVDQPQNLSLTELGLRIRKSIADAGPQA